MLDTEIQYSPFSSRASIGSSSHQLFVIQIMGKTISAKLIARAVLVSSSFAVKGTFFSSYRPPAEGTQTFYQPG
jgi:hypothetical protein